MALPTSVGELANRVNRSGARIIPLGLLIGILFPSLASALRPTLAVLVIIMVIAALVRVDPRQLLARLRRPARSVLATFWILVAIPAIVMSAATALGVTDGRPQITLILFIATAPMTIQSAPSFALLAGLDATLALAVVLLSMMTTSFVTPFLADLFLSTDLPLSSLMLGRNLGVMILIGVSVAVAIRRIAGSAHIETAGSLADCAAVAAALLFAIAAMDTVGAAILDKPGLVAIVLAATFVSAFTQMIVTYGVFRHLIFRDPADAVTLAYCSSSRNMSLILAAMGAGIVPDLVWLFFALGQIPIFTVPLLFRIFGHRLTPAAA